MERTKTNEETCSGIHVVQPMAQSVTRNPSKTPILQAYDAQQQHAQQLGRFARERQVRFGPYGKIENGPGPDKKHATQPVEKVAAI